MSHQCKVPRSTTNFRSQTGWLVDYAYNPTPPETFGWSETALDLGFVSPAALGFVHFQNILPVERFIRTEIYHQVDARMASQAPKQRDLIVMAGGGDEIQLVTRLGSHHRCFQSAFHLDSGLVADT